MRNVLLFLNLWAIILTNVRTRYLLLNIGRDTKKYPKLDELPNIDGKSLISFDKLKHCKIFINANQIFYQNKIPNLFWFHFYNNGLILLLHLFDIQCGKANMIQPDSSFKSSRQIGQDLNEDYMPKNPGNGKIGEQG